LGLRYLIWEVAHRPHWSRGGGRIYLQAAGAASARQPWAGALVVGLVAVVLFLYARAGYGPQGVFLLFGAAFGVVFQRSRFCLVRAFREPFMTGDAEHTRAAALALVLSTLGFAILKYTDLKDKSEWVFPAAGIGSLAGGLAFGVGMTLAGGCGAGSLWRAGEGQVKLWVAVACFALGASLARLVAAQTGLLQKPGRRVVVIGGGWGGTSAAKYVRLADPSIEVILLEPNKEFVSCPFSNLVLSGVRTIESLTFNYDRLRAQGVKVLHETATMIEPDSRRVRVGYDALPYD